MPKHHLKEFNDTEIINNLKRCLQAIRLVEPRRVVTSQFLSRQYNLFFPATKEVPLWYLRSLIAEPHFKFVDPIGWTVGC